MCELYVNGVTVKQIAERYGVSSVSVYTLTRSLSRDDAVMNDGEYKAIPGLDKYMVSTVGHVVSFAQGGRAKEIKTYPSTNGRNTVALSAYDELIRVHVDELVSTLFLGNGGADQRVVHIDGDWSNDSVDNLKWEDIPVVVTKVQKRISDEIVESIRQDWINRIKTSEICDKYGVSKSFVHNATKNMRLDIIAPSSEHGEVWADVNGYEGCYMVSSHGRVYSTGNGRRNPVMLKPSANSKGYQTVHLSDGNGRQESACVHRLVAAAFCDGHSETRNIVNHIDGNPSNNNADNLEWCTYGENTRHAIEVLGKKMGGNDQVKRVTTRTYPVDANSARSPLRRFSDDEVKFIRSDYHSSSQLAKMLGVNKSTIQRMRNGETYRNI